MDHRDTGLRNESEEDFELESWRRLIADGDWAVKEYWLEFQVGQDEPMFTITPERIRHFMAYLVRLIDGEPEC